VQAFTSADQNIRSTNGLSNESLGLKPGKALHGLNILPRVHAGQLG
jgi:hypothetical protein